MKYVDTVVNTVAFSSIFQHCFVVVQYIRRRFQRYVAHAADSTLLCYTRHELCHVVIVVNTVAFNTVSFFRRARRIFQYRVEYIVPGSFQHLAVHTVAFKAVLYVVHNVAFNTVLPCTHVAFNTILHILQLSTVLYIQYLVVFNPVSYLAQNGSTSSFQHSACDDSVRSTRIMGLLREYRD